MRGRKRTSNRPAGGDSVAARVGQRIRAARLAAGLTQQQLAGDRYTKAYVSALENAHVKPSMVALEFLAGRLGTSASRLIATDDPEWGKLGAELLLATRDWQAAADAYSRLSATVVDRGERAEALRGLAEARVRLGEAGPAEQAASESMALFEGLGREADAALAGFWQAAALIGQGNAAEAKQTLRAILDRDPAGRSLDPTFRLQLVMAIASIEAREGNHAAALGYLDEIQSLAGPDDRRRAEHLLKLAHDHRDNGDFEAARRAGYASLALFERANMAAEVAGAENILALSYLASGDVRGAAQLAASARQRLERLDEQRALASVAETEAQIAAERDDWDTAQRLAQDALDLARRTDNQAAAIGALLTTARAKAAQGDQGAALEAHAEAGDAARNTGDPHLLRRALGAWAEALAQAGDHAAAYTLTREALGAA